MSHLNNVYSAQTIAHSQMRQRREVEEDTRHVLASTLAPLKAQIAATMAHNERQEQRQQQTALQLERLIDTF